MADKKPEVKRPRRINLAINQLLKQRDKAIGIRDKAAAEVAELDAALLALGYPE